jgi:hypothetical protein
MYHTLYRKQILSVWEGVTEIPKRLQCPGCSERGGLPVWPTVARRKRYGRARDRPEGGGHGFVDGRANTLLRGKSKYETETAAKGHANWLLPKRQRGSLPEGARCALWSGPRRNGP